MVAATPPFDPAHAYPLGYAQTYFLPGVLTFLILLLILAFIILYNRTSRRLKEETQSKDQLKQRLAEVEMKVLRAQMNPHFIFNSLNSINRYIVRSEPALASAYLTRFAKLMRMILENSHSKAISLEQELASIKLYVELESLRFNKKFNYNIQIDPGINAAAFGIPPLIIQPFIENAIWHGLLHRDVAGELNISIQAIDKGIRCIISDNGIGREKAAQLKSKSINTDKSYGMKITSERLAQAHNGSIIIEDLKDQFGNAAGTRVTLEIGMAKLEDY